MFPENHVVLHVDNVHRVFRIVVLQVLQDFQLNARLVVVFLFVLDYLERNFLLSFVVEALDGDSEASLAQERHDFVAVGDVVLDVDAIVPF